MNILWSYVQSRFVPEPLLAVLGEHLARDDIAGSLRGLDWASLVWSFASLGRPLAPAALDALNSRGACCLVEMTPLELCNLLW